MSKYFSGLKLLQAALLLSFFAVSVETACAGGSNASDVPPVILFIGDSHSTGSFGMQQDAVLRSVKGFRVATYAICGSSPDNWFSGDKTSCGYFFKDVDGREQRGWEAATPLIANLIAQYQPAYTVVELGANMYGRTPEWVEKTSHEMAMAIVNSGSKCIWIGPPHARIQTDSGLAQVFDALHAGVGAYCLLFDSRNVTRYPAVGGDGIHFNSLGESGARIAENWAISAYYAFSPLLKARKPAK